MAICSPGDDFNTMTDDDHIPYIRREAIVLNIKHTKIGKIGSFKKYNNIVCVKNSSCSNMILKFSTNTHYTALFRKIDKT